MVSPKNQDKCGVHIITLAMELMWEVSDTQD